MDEGDESKTVPSTLKGRLLDMQSDEKGTMSLLMELEDGTRWVYYDITILAEHVQQVDGAISSLSELVIQRLPLPKNGPPS